MNSIQAKQITITDYLKQYGMIPEKEQNENLWYYSPFRQEHTPSFKVNRMANCWYDYGMGKGGNIIDLVMLLHGIDNISDALRYLTLNFPVVSSPSASFQQQPITSSVIGLEIMELRHPALMAYLKERNIEFDIARKYCKEVHYQINQQPYFAIGFKNDAGGYELRNQYFKGAVSPKDITVIKNGSDACCVFEGFMDYLSFLTFLQNGNQHFSDFDKQDCVVLNSVANLSKAMETIRSYEWKSCFLDNDEAGRKALKEIENQCKGVSNRSVYYSEFKDLNDYLRHVQKQAVENKNTLKSEDKRVVKLLNERKFGCGRRM